MTTRSSRHSGVGFGMQRSPAAPSSGRDWSRRRCSCCGTSTHRRAICYRSISRTSDWPMCGYIRFKCVTAMLRAWKKTTCDLCMDHHRSMAVNTLGPFTGAMICRILNASSTVVCVCVTVRCRQRPTVSPILLGAMTEDAKIDESVSIQFGTLQGQKQTLTFPRGSTLGVFLCTRNTHAVRGRK